MAAHPGVIFFLGSVVVELHSFPFEGVLGSPDEDPS